MAVYPINSTPKYISGVYSQPYIVKNSGDETVYLGQDSSLTVSTRAFSLPPGSTLNWSGSTELWGITDTGKVSEIELLYTGQNSFSPGPSTVFAKSSNEPVLLFTAAGSFPIGANHSNITNAGAPIDISKYASIIFRINCNLLQYPTPLRADSYMSLDAQQFSNDGAFYSPLINAQFLVNTMNNLQSSSLQIPVVNSTLVFNFDLYKTAAFASDGTFGITIYGSNETIPAPKYIHDSLDMFGTIPVGGAFSADHVGVLDASYFVATKSGNGKLQFINVNGTATGFLLAYCYEDGNAIALASLLVPAYAGQSTTDLSLPYRPFLLRLSQTTAGKESIATLIQ